MKTIRAVKTLFKPLANCGDTIIEVMLAMTVVSMMLSGAYTVTSRSFNNTRQAQERGEALKLIERQVEQFRALQSTHLAELDDEANFFCLDAVRTDPIIVMPALTNVDDFGNYGDCATTLSSSGAEFLISVEDRNNDDVFVFRAKWFKAGGGTVDEIRILYKLPPTP